jgi:hypothetical protein
MTANWSVEWEREAVEADAAEDVRYASDPTNYVPCVCGRRVLDGSVCRYCGEPTESWIAANSHESEDDCPLDGDAESALASAGFGMDEDYNGGVFPEDPWEFDGGDLWSDG